MGGDAAPALTQRPASIAYLACTLRQEATLQLFLDMAAGRGLVVQEVWREAKPGEGPLAVVTSASVVEAIAHASGEFLARVFSVAAPATALP